MAKWNDPNWVKKHHRVTIYGSCEVKILGHNCYSILMQNMDNADMDSLMLLYYKEGRLHNPTGPAIFNYSTGKKSFFLEGKQFLTKKEYRKAAIEYVARKSKLGLLIF